jgi:hypothetical protein
MARCAGQIVVLESPTIPTFTPESAGADSFELETGAISIDVGDVSLCECGEIIATLLIRYDGQFLYDGSITYA